MTGKGVTGEVVTSKGVTGEGVTGKGVKIQMLSTEVTKINDIDKQASEKEGGGNVVNVIQESDQEVVLE